MNIKNLLSITKHFIYIITLFIIILLLFFFFFNINKIVNETKNIENKRYFLNFILYKIITMYNVKTNTT